MSFQYQKGGLFWIINQNPYDLYYWFVNNKDTIKFNLNEFESFFEDDSNKKIILKSKIDFDSDFQI